MSEDYSDFAVAVQTALTLTKIRETSTLNHLQFISNVAEQLKRTPKLKPSKPLRLTELGVALPEEEKREEPAEPKQHWFDRIAQKLRRRFKR